MIKKRINKLNNKKGFITIDAILALATALAFAFLFLGLMFLMIPKFTMQGEVHSLAQLARIQGGLYEKDVEKFKAEISESTGAPLESIHVVLKNEETNVQYDKLADGQYAKHGNGEILQLYVIVPTNKFIQAPLKFFGMKNVENLEYYNFQETVVSEKW